MLANIKTSYYRINSHYYCRFSLFLPTDIHGKLLFTNYSAILLDQPVTEVWGELYPNWHRCRTVYLTGSDLDSVTQQKDELFLAVKQKLRDIYLESSVPTLLYSQELTINL